MGCHELIFSNHKPVGLLNFGIKKHKRARFMDFIFITLVVVRGTSTRKGRFCMKVNESTRPRRARTFQKHQLSTGTGIHDSQVALA
jgi:hypothetical protein